MNMAHLFDECLAYAMKRIGKDGLCIKDEQKQAIQDVYKGKDVFVWLPTGYGKSVCYECLPFLYDMKLDRHLSEQERSVVLVISPLVSLMVDQVSSLRSRGVPAAILSSQGSIDKSLLATEGDLSRFGLLFAAPEAIIGVEKWRNRFLEPPLCNQVVAIAVDEAHCLSRWSRTFRPSYARLGEVRAIVPPGTPMIALTATATRAVRSDIIAKLEMTECKLVHLSPNRPNIYYEVRPRLNVEEDMAPIVNDLLTNKQKAQRILIYCRSLNMCADLFAHFSYALGEANSYFPPNAEHISDNRLYGMFHAKTPDHNKEVILKSMQDGSGVVRVVFCTIALGMGVNFAGLNYIIHYGAPRSIEDYFQECGRAGRSGEPARSVIYWTPVEAPLRKKLINPCDAEIAAVRHYLENVSECRRRQLLSYFDSSFCSDLAVQDHLLCCDVCANAIVEPEA